jgi:dUTP pyrophosphatase
MVPRQGRALVPTDIAIAIPPGHYGRVAPRSGLAVKSFIDVGAGVVDCDYRGPLSVVLFNHRLHFMHF